MSTVTGLRIAEVTRRTGFSAPALRYYEEIGLLPPAARGANGYRVFDERTVERLTFVARAKQLGCSLTEIKAMLAAWDDDCEDVCHQLRALVDDKIATAQRRTTELVALTAQLQQAAAALRESPRSGGPCGDGCACLTSATSDVRGTEGMAAGATPTDPAAMGSPVRNGVQFSDADPDIVCTLGAGDDDPAAAIDARVSEWQAVLGHAVARHPIDGGVRVTFSPDVPVAELARLAHAEQGCCSFFSFALVLERGQIALEVRAPQAALPLVTSLFGS